MVHSVRIGISEGSEKSDAMRFALCPMRLKSQITNKFQTTKTQILLDMLFDFINALARY